MRLLPIFLGFLLLIGNGSAALAASPKAMAMRQANGLTAFTPPEKFLAGNFVADEMNPTVHFRSRCKPLPPPANAPRPGSSRRGIKIARPGGSSDKPAEYTVYLEEDCPDKVVYYVFIDQSGLTPQQWIDWRYKFHEEQDGAGVWPDQIQTGTGLHGGLRGRRRVAFHPEKRGSRWTNLRKQSCSRISNMPRSTI